MNKYYKSLELDKILQLLSENAVSDEAKHKALKIKPDNNFENVQCSLNETSCAHSLLLRYGYPIFSKLNNVSLSLSRAKVGASLNTDELLKIADVLHTFRNLIIWYDGCLEKTNELDIYFSNLYQNKYFENKIYSIILGSDHIADNASPELCEIRKKINVQASGIREKLDSMVHDVKMQQYLQDTVVTQRNGRYVLPVKAEYRNSVNGLVHDTSSSGSTVFIEPSAVVQANNEIKVLESDERNEIQRILSELSAEAASFSANIISSYDAAVQLDLIFAKASLAIKMKAIKPNLNREGVTDLKKARHPLIDNDKVVPTDISIGGTFDTLIITGPNTGGKTVSLKTLGLLTLMTMCGLMIPTLENSNVCVFSAVLSDIDAVQDIQQNLSTFSSQMTNVIHIMKVADENTLVLLDELCAGTDPAEGAALSVAIIEYLRQSGAKIAVTTHYTDLKVYAMETPGIINACCEFDIDTLKPTYKLLMGIPGRSNAFAISQRLGMDDEVINNAKKYVTSSNRTFENALSELEAERHKLQGETAKAQHEKKIAESMKRQAQSEKDKIVSRSENEIQKAQQEARKIVENAKRKSNEFLFELDRIKNTYEKTDNLKALRRQVNNLVDDLDETIETRTKDSTWNKNYKLPRELEIGDAVRIKDIGVGEVLEKPCNGSVMVQSGQLKIRAKTEDVQLIKKSNASTQFNVKITRSYTKMDENLKNHIDLRGKTVDEAISEVDAFIYQCILSNIDTVSIIHGKGTGALRKAVHNFLRSNPHVKEFRLGEYGEGDTGITIATLK